VNKYTVSKHINKKVFGSLHLLANSIVADAIRRSRLNCRGPGWKNKKSQGFWKDSGESS